MPTNTPNMNIPNPIVGQDSGLVWEQSVNAGNDVIDAHNHTSGHGVPIPPSGLNINASLPFNGQQATNLQAVVFSPQTSVSTTYAVYSIGVDLYFTDGSGNVVRLTSGGSVNATSSGITSGTATASFVSSVLVVNSASTTPANIQAGSVLFGNNTAGSFYVTVQPVNALGASYSLTLPQLPASQKIMTLDASGNMSAPYTVDNSTIAISANVIGVPAQGITAAKIANGTITGTQVATSINLPGGPQAAGLNVIANGANTSNTLKIYRGTIGGTGGILAGEGFTVVHGGTGSNNVTFNNAFFDTPVVLVNVQGGGAGVPLFAYAASVATTGFQVNSFNSTTGANATTSFIAIGQR